jgi:uncharacterized membrane protein
VDHSLGVMQTIGSLASEDPQHPPAYYVITHLWTHQFGSSVAALRTPAAIFGVLVLPCVFWLALELFGSLGTALIAVALVAASPFFVLYSQEAREYSMWTVLTALQCVAFLRAIRSNALVFWVAYGAITAISLYVYPLTGLVALGLAGYLLVQQRGRPTRAMIACVLADLAALALFVPWLKAMATSSGVGRGMAGVLMSKLALGQIVRIFARDLRLVFFDFGQPHAGRLGPSAIDTMLTLITVALCAYAFVSLIRRTRFSVWGFIVVGLCVPAAPLLLYDIFIGGNFVYQGRYFLPLILGMELAVAAFFDRALFRRASWSNAQTSWAIVLSLLLTGSVLSCIVASQATTWWNKDYERSRAVAALINASQRPIVISNYFTPSILELSLYLDPMIPMRLNLKCAQCAFVRPSVAIAAPGYRNVFALQASGTAIDTRYNWVDPHPFPAQPSPLNMFATVASP